MCQAMNVGGATEVALNVAVASQASAYSRSVNTAMVKYFGLQVKCVSSSGSPAIKVQWEAGHTSPTTETAADTNFVVPDGMTDLATNITDEVYHVIGVNPPPMEIGRLKFTGNAANPADTLVTARLWMQG